MESQIIKKTALYDVHVGLGAKMLPFAGYQMPIRYSGDKDEHLTVRNAVGVFDVSHMGEFLFKGESALEFLQKITSNDVSKLHIGKAQYSCLPNLNGGVVDDIIVYRLDNAYMMVVNAANIAKDWEWILARQKEFGFQEVEIQDLSEQTSLLAVSGPLSTEVVKQLTDIEVERMGYYEVRRGSCCGFPNIVIATTGYTGEWTYEIFCRNEEVLTIWEQLFKVGQPYGIKPTGLGARDTLRLEMGYMLYGNELNDHTSPIEAGLQWITKLDKGTFCSSETFQKQKTEGTSRKLIGFEMVDKAIPRSHYVIKNAEGQTIGEVTSGTISPCLEKGIGMGYVQALYAQPGTEIFIEVRNTSFKAVVVKPPFVKNTSVQLKTKK